MLLTIVTFIVILSLLVFVHELGHFLSARYFGLLPEEFGFGFPPRVWGIYKAKDGKWKTVKGKRPVEDAADTIYSINALPLGGFVKLGEDDTEIAPDANHFHNKPVWQRAIMLLAGVTMNIIFAAVLISVGFMFGMPQVVEGLPKSAIVESHNVQVVDVLPGSAADTAGLKIGDFVISINGENFTNSDALRLYTDQHDGQTLQYDIKRGDETFTREIIPSPIEGSGQAGIGIGIVDTGLVRYPIPIAIWEGIKATGYLFLAIIMAFYELIKSLMHHSSVDAQIAGPVGIAVLTGQVARMGIAYIIQFAATLSVNLAIINALPFPALDGGRVLFLIIEKIKGRPVKRELEGTIHYIGFALLMGLVLVVTFKDLSRFGDTFKTIWQAIVG